MNITIIISRLFVAINSLLFNKVSKKGSSLEKIEKKGLLVSGTILFGIVLGGLPAYIISLLNSPVSREGVFLLLWLMFSIPFGLVFYIFLLKWYQEKENKFQY